MSTKLERPGEVDRRREVDGSPAARSARPNPTDSASSRRPSISSPVGAQHGLGHAHSLDAPSAQAWAVASARYGARVARTWRMSSSYLRTTPSVSSTTSGSAPGTQRQECGRPVERLGDARDLGQVRVAQPVDEPDDLAGERARRVGDPGRDDLELLGRGRVVDPVIQAAALERVVDLAGPVRGEDDRGAGRRGSCRSRGR